MRGGYGGETHRVSGPAVTPQRLRSGTAGSVCHVRFTLGPLLRVRGRARVKKSLSAKMASRHYARVMGAPPRNGSLSDSAEIEGLLSAHATSGLVRFRPLSSLPLEF